MRLKKILQILIILFTTSFTTSFQILPHKMRNIIYKHYRMSSEPLNDYNEIINFIPSFQCNIIINNWINYLDGYNINHDKSFIYKPIYDMKMFVAINKEEKNTVLITWCPDNGDNKNTVAYIVGAKIFNNTLHIHRIAQNPYYNNIIDLKSIDFFKKLNELNLKTHNISSINFDELDKYDIRYSLSNNI